ncbi:cell division protein FtsQ/DivIB [Acuticoccus mangrovi]|uniref:cell division protein FtsQ/DivIB n=1 Tax=Acuticoccus mangrovi TaxID=2796142 RepID=UPI002FCC5D2E
MTPSRRHPDARFAGPMPGRILALVVLLGSGGAGLAYSDDPSAVIDVVGRASGFQVRYVKLTGQKETSDSAIVASVGLDPSASLLTVDARETRQRLEALPWVTKATVRKILPGTLDVEIEEAEAFARWQIDGTEMVIAKDGSVLTDEVPFAYRNLPLVAGSGANERVDEARTLLEAHPGIDARTVAAVLVNDRRWDLRLANGATVRLPEKDASRALSRLEDLEAQGALLAAGPIVIDMRLVDRTTVQLDVDGNAAEGLDPIDNLPQGPSEPFDPLAATIAASGLDPLALAIAEAQQ